MSKRIEYIIKIGCDVDEFGNVIPNGATHHAEDKETGETLNMAEYPSAEKIMIIWAGIYYQWPRVGEKDL